MHRRLYLTAALVAAAVVFAGFARTYYLKGLFDTPALPLLRHVHGAVMTTWFLLFVGQTWLVSSRRVAVHRRLGIGGAVLAGIVVVVGVAVAIDAARRGASPGPPPLVFFAVPFGDMAVFAALTGLAVWFRRKPEYHRRLMLLGTLSILPAAIGRIPFEFLLQGGPLVYFGLTDLLIAGCVASDAWRNGRLHPAFGWGAAFVVASHPFRLWLSTTNAWMRFATWVTA